MLCMRILVAHNFGNRMHRAIQRRSHQVIHCRIHNNERFTAAFLHVDNPCQQHTRGPNDRPTRLQEKVQPERLEYLRNHARVRFAGRRLFRRVANSESTAKVEIFQRNSVLAQFSNVTGQPMQGTPKRIHRHNLRADMNADSLPTDPLRFPMRKIQTACLVPVEPKLVLVTPSRDMRVTAGLYIRVHANRNRRSLAAASGAARRFFQQNLQFGFRLHIEKENPAEPAFSRR